MTLNSFRTFCWRCGYYRNEWLNWRIFFERKGRCFYCRIDAIDKKYGPGYLADMYKTRKGYRKPPPTRWELLRLRSHL